MKELDNFFKRAKKDPQLISKDGIPIKDDINGLIIRRTPAIEDERGELVEVYRPSWGISEKPMAYSYYLVVRPKVIKGWVLHKEQDDRIFIISGVQRWVFFDNRDNSSTYKNIVSITVTEHSRALIIIPAGVYHAVQNLGDRDATYFNIPTNMYNYENPDKYRLPLKNDLIPFDFGSTLT
jgi:dTDP-4-dehydrorhamnose 3,5-epimerase